jgi:two-component system phosphate regulon sensor histidine kinase PhoR
MALLGITAAWHGYARARRASAEANRLAAERAILARKEDRVANDLRLARHQLDALGEAALDGLLLLDDNRQILWGNAAAWEIFRAGRPAIGQPFIALAHDVELNQAVIDALSEARSIVRQTAADARTLRIQAVPLDDHEGSASVSQGGAAVAIEDVTELQRLGRVRRDLIANISHELRTPLANIDLAAQTLRSSGFADPEIRGRMLDQIQSYVQNLSQLSQEMMDLAQIESGQVLLRLVPVQLEPLVQQAIRLLMPHATVKQQTLQIDVPDDIVALADDQQVTRVILNLVQNAIKFTPDGGTIWVAATLADEEDVQVCVKDNGPGIQEAEQSRIFERFYKADRARSRGGTGLGLAIARHIVEGHGGRIWVESVPGQGATFCFTLPRA